jgi:transcriptional regulator with XRE-family HTH domain
VTFYDILEEIRQELGLTQAQFLRLIRTPRATYKKWRDNPDAAPQPQKLESVGDALRVRFTVGIGRHVTGWRRFSPSEMPTGSGRTFDPPSPYSPRRLPATAHDQYERIGTPAGPWDELPEEERKMFELAWRDALVRIEQLTRRFEHEAGEAIFAFERMVIDRTLRRASGDI